MLTDSTVLCIQKELPRSSSLNIRTSFIFYKYWLRADLLINLIIISTYPGQLLYESNRVLRTCLRQIEKGKSQPIDTRQTESEYGRPSVNSILMLRYRIPQSVTLNNRSVCE